MDNKDDKDKKVLDRILKDITRQQMAELMIELIRELEDILKYLKKIRYSSTHIQFQARIGSEAFYNNVVKPLEGIVRWNEQKEKQIRKEAEEEGQNVKNNPWHEGRNMISVAKVAKTGGKIAIGGIIGAIITGYLYKKKKKKKEDAGK